MTKKTIYVLLEDEWNHNIFYDRESRRDGYAIPFVYLTQEIEKAGFIFKPTFDYTQFPDAACLISFNAVNNVLLQTLSKNPIKNSFLFLMEPPIVHSELYDRRLARFFSRIYTPYDDVVDNEIYFKFHHQQCNEKFAENIPEFEKKKLCIMIQSNNSATGHRELFTERKKAAAFFAKTGDFDLYGSHWHGNSSWKGQLPNGKLEIIKNYKFYICYENLKDQYGWITERVFTALWAGCVPVYYGPLNVCDYIPKECFINILDYSSYEELYLFMKNMDKKTYQSYIDAAQNFLNSPKFEPFTTRYFSKFITNQILDVCN